MIWCNSKDGQLSTKQATLHLSTTVTVSWAVWLWKKSIRPSNSFVSRKLPLRKEVARTFVDNVKTLKWIIELVTWKYREAGVKMATSPYEEPQSKIIEENAKRMESFLEFIQMHFYHTNAFFLWVYHNFDFICY
ncbi:unnamed protein product [Trifolium pratense]|uniref:Uncharacterized protein n=1 Tax=Trifolium pratense TaxID=57577 RepID=A0ACB0K2L5_TRIPR|nr:unnamed protein product [Trifolium pratense]